MSDIIITNPFNKPGFINNHKRVWAGANKKVLNTYLKNSFIIVVLLLVCITTDQEKGFPIITVLTIGLCFYIIMKWIEFFERRYKYFKLIGKQAVEYEQKSMACTYVLSDEWFVYTDDEKSFKFQWHLLKTFQHTGNMIVLSFNGGLYFPLDDNEMDNDTFTKACDFFKAKAEMNIKK